MSSFTPELITAFYAQHLKHFHPNFIFPSRRVEHYELAYLMNPDECQVSLDDRDYKFKGDAIIFRRPGQINQSFMPYESILLTFKLEGADADSLLSGLSSIYPSHQVEGLRQVFEDIYKESLSNRPYSAIYQSAKLSELIYTLYHDTDAYRRLHSPHISNEHMLSILKYVDQTLDQPFTIAAMSQDLSLSQRHIYHLFKEHMASTPIHYINQCRLNKSKGHLANSNLPIHQIAHLCGYDNVSYFITLFGKTYGLTPAKFRQQAQ